MGKAYYYALLLREGEFPNEIKPSFPAEEGAGARRMESQDQLSLKLHAKARHDTKRQQIIL